jgi:hypothetical protein
MGPDDTDGHGQSLEPGTTDARLRSRFVPQKTAFVFAGGGSLGAVHVGMLRRGQGCRAFGRLYARRRLQTPRRQSRHDRELLAGPD